jgi:hypothetical protein
MLMIGPSPADAVAQASSSSSLITKPEIVAALITAAFTLLAILLKDFLLRWISDRRSDRKAETAIYERYSNPLVKSAVSLLHRLNEILFKEHRPIYLQKRSSFETDEGLHGSYLYYKRLSTAYRIAVILGWIQACRREFSYLRVARPEKAEDVHRAIDSFEKALADGGWVEQERVRRLCELWQLNKTESSLREGDKEQIGIRVNNLLWSALEKSGLSKENAAELSEEAKRGLCRSTADCITGYLKADLVSNSAMDGTWHDAFKIITMREAWIFRDWQSAIGDVMTLKSDPGDRNFDVIGYGSFEQFSSSGTAEQKLAVKRLLAVLDGIDLSTEDRFDARRRQLRAVAGATAALVIGFHKTQGKHSIASQFEVNLARDMTAKIGSQPS